MSRGREVSALSFRGTALTAPGPRGQATGGPRSLDCLRWPREGVRVLWPQACGPLALRPGSRGPWPLSLHWSPLSTQFPLSGQPGALGALARAAHPTALPLGREDGGVELGGRRRSRTSGTQVPAPSLGRRSGTLAGRCWVGRCHGRQVGGDRPEAAAWCLARETPPSFPTDLPHSSPESPRHGQPWALEMPLGRQPLGAWPAQAWRTGSLDGPWKHLARWQGGAESQGASESAGGTGRTGGGRARPLPLGPGLGLSTAMVTTAAEQTRPKSHGKKCRSLGTESENRAGAAGKV